MKYCYNCGALLQKEPPTNCSQCGTEHWKNPRCCAGSLIIKGDELLLVRRLSPPWAGFWDIPGGYCEAHEHPEACASREALEETGVSIQIQSYHGIWLEPESNSLYGSNICIYYIAEPIGDYSMIPDGKETDKVRWFKLNCLPKKMAFSNHILDVLKKLTETIEPTFR